MSWGRIPVGLEEMYLRGTVECGKCCLVIIMVGKEIGSSLPISLQKKLVFKKVFNKDIEM